MPRSRVLTITILACALLAAILFGAAAVLGWVLARPIGVIAGIAAITNIALISSPTDGRARRIAMVFGAAVLVLAAASGAWGFVSNAPVWLCLMPIGGAILMIPEVLNLMTPAPQTPSDKSDTEEDLAALPEPVVHIDGEDDMPATSEDQQHFFSRADPIREEDVDTGINPVVPATGPIPSPSGPSAGSASGPTAASADTGSIPPVADDDTDPSIPVWRESAAETTGRHGIITADAPQDAAEEDPSEITGRHGIVPDQDPADDQRDEDTTPRRGRRAIMVDWDEDDEEVDNDDPDDLPRGRRAR